MPVTCDWIVFYDDGSSFSSLDGKPHEAPRAGAICVTTRSAEHGRNLWVGKDYFWWDEDGTWVNGDMTGLLDYLARPGSYKVVLIGRGRPAPRFHAVCRMALADMRLPEKTSTDWLESPET